MTQFNEATFSDAALEEEGLAWVNRLLAGPLSHDDAQALLAWRGQSTAHEAMFVETVTFQRKVRSAVMAARREPVDLPQAANSGATRSGATASTRPSLARQGGARSGVARRALLGGALAASVVGGAVLVRSRNGWPPLRADYHSGVGERRSETPAPGVALELDVLTDVDLRPSRDLPGIELVSGKAEIAAQRPLDAPFAIAARGGKVLLAQGKIDVRNQDGSVCVTCLEGRAQVRHPLGDLWLEAGRQVVYTKQALGQAAAADLTLVTAWRRGLLIFRDAPLQQVVDELNRYRKGKIVLLDAALASRPVYGIFQLEQIDGAVGQIERLTGARALALPGDIVVLR